MYVSPNFPTKKALKEAVAAGRQVTAFQPNSDIYGGRFPANGTLAVEGPHYPEPHRWYAMVEVKDGIVTKVKS